MHLSKKTLMIIIGVVVAIVAIFVGRMIFTPQRTAEQAIKDAEAARVAVQGWRIKHDARLASNKTRTKEAKQALINFYDAESGALAEQQRLLDALVAADAAEAENSVKKIEIDNFRISNISFEKLNVRDSEASITAKIEYYIRYKTQAQTYSTYGVGTYEWKLKKVKKNWKIIEEKLVPGDEA